MNALKILSVDFSVLLDKLLGLLQRKSGYQEIY